VLLVVLGEEEEEGAAGELLELTAHYLAQKVCPRALRDEGETEGGREGGKEEGRSETKALPKEGRGPEGGREGGREGGKGGREYVHCTCPRRQQARHRAPSPP